MRGPMKLIRDIRAAGTFHKAVKSMQAGDYQSVLDRRDGFQTKPYFTAKAELFRAMARHRQDRFPDAVPVGSYAVLRCAPSWPLWR